MPESAWQRRVRRILFFAGSATSVYLFVGYLLARMRDARIRALRDRREKEV
jgi:peroxin-3